MHLFISTDNLISANNLFPRFLTSQLIWKVLTIFITQSEESKQ